MLTLINFGVDKEEKGRWNFSLEFFKRYCVVKFFGGRGGRDFVKM